MEREYTLIEIPENKTTTEELERELSFVLPSLFQTINVLNGRVSRLENCLKQIVKNKPTRPPKTAPLKKSLDENLARNR